MKILWIFALGVNGNNLAPDSLANIDAAKKELARTDAYDCILLTGGLIARGQTRPVAELMKEALGETSVDVLLSAQSTNTRDDVTKGMARLPAGLSHVSLKIVSEKWHTIQIKSLLSHYRMVHQPEFIPSGYKAKPITIFGRITWLLLHRSSKN